MDSILAMETNRPSQRMKKSATALCRAAALALCLGLCAAPAVAFADEAPGGRAFSGGVRLQDEIVVVNTRMLCGSTDPDSLASGVMVENYAVTDEAGHRRWRRSDLESFVSFDPSVPTIFFVHGNQITPGEAKSQGLAVYRRLMRYGCEEGPIRFVIYSWPSSRVGRLLQDVRVKAARTGPAGYQLAWLLNQMPAETPVSLIGFSFGARIVTGSLHVLAGGSLGYGRELDQRANPNRPPVNVVLIGAALHANWLGEGQYHGLAMTQVDKAFLLNNCRDLALRYYRLSTPGRDRPQALGLHGPTCIGPKYAAKIMTRDVSSSAGRQHDLFMYLCAPGATSLAWHFTGEAAENAEGEPVAMQAAARSIN